MIYDFIIIGAGSAGSNSAYFLNKRGAKVLVLEQFNIASGGSGAAGAFISPRLGKGGPLQKVTNESFKFSIDFYKRNFADCFYQTGILRLLKDEDDAKKIEDYKRFLDVDYRFLSSDEIELSDYAKRYGGFFFESGGVVDAKRVCKKLLDGIDVKCGVSVKEIKREGKLFNIEGFRAKNIILATGAWDKLFKNSYFKIGKVAGIRLDVKTNLNLPYSIHKRVSISKKIDEKVAIGATHERVENVSQDYPKREEFLLNEAKRMTNINDFEILNRFYGVRSSVNDHFPIIGELIDISKVDKKTKEISRVKGVYVINGLGGRGFVFGPYVAKMLVDNIIENKKIDDRLNLDRYFFRYIKRL